VRAVRRHFQAPGQQLPVGLEHRLRFFGQAEHGPVIAASLVPSSVNSTRRAVRRSR
jgi:hypothetical protein